MATGKIYQDLLTMKRQNRSGFAVLIDPDKVAPADMIHLAKLCNDAAVDYVLMGGSLVVADNLEACIQRYKAESDIPVILFPGSFDFAHWRSGRDTIVCGAALLLSAMLNLFAPIQVNQNL